MTLTAEAAHAAYERAVALRVHLAREALAAGRNTRRLAEEHDTPALQEQVHAAAMARALGLRPVPGVANSALAAMQYVDRTRKRDRSGAPTAHTTAAALLDRGVNTINRVHAQLNTYRQEAVQRMITQRIVRSCVHHLIGETWDTHRAHYLQAFRWLRGAKPWTAVQVGRRMGKSMAVAQTFIAIALQCPGIQIGVLGNSHRVTMLMLVYLARLYNEYVARDDAQFPVDADGNVMRPIGFNHVKTSHIEIVFPDGRRSKVSAFPASPNVRHARRCCCVFTRARAHTPARTRDGGHGVRVSMLGYVGACECVRVRRRAAAAALLSARDRCRARGRAGAASLRGASRCLHVSPSFPVPQAARDRRRPDAQCRGRAPRGGCDCLLCGVAVCDNHSGVCGGDRVPGGRTRAWLNVAAAVLGRACSACSGGCRRVLRSRWAHRAAWGWRRVMVLAGCAC